MTLAPTAPRGLPSTPVPTDPSRIPMPPTMWLDHPRLTTVAPDRCPAGHRHHVGRVDWLIDAPIAGSPVEGYRCLACDPTGATRFEARPDLYDALSWWDDEWQQVSRVYWHPYPRPARRAWADAERAMWALTRAARVCVRLPHVSYGHVRR